MSAPPIPDIEAFEERAAIAEYDGELTRLQVDSLAAQGQDFAGPLQPALFDNNVVEQTLSRD